MREDSVAAAVLTRGRARSMGNLATVEPTIKGEKEKINFASLLRVHYLKVSIELIIILFQILQLT